MEALEHRWQVLQSQVISEEIDFQTDDYFDLANIHKIVTNLKVLAQQLRTDAQIITDLQKGSVCRMLLELNCVVSLVLRIFQIAL